MLPFWEERGRIFRGRTDECVRRYVSCGRECVRAYPQFGLLKFFSKGHVSQEKNIFLWKTFARCSEEMGNVPLPGMKVACGTYQPSVYPTEGVFSPMRRLPHSTLLVLLRLRAAPLLVLLAVLCGIYLVPQTSADNQQTPRAGGPGGAQTSVLLFAARSIPHSGLPAIAVGEASHGADPMLFARNRLIRELAAEGRISWVALETGYAEALLDRFVRGDPGTEAGRSFRRSESQFS